MRVTVTDYAGEELKPGSFALYGAPGDGDDPRDYVVIVTSISDPDGDYDDELGRGVEITPRVSVRFASGDEDRVVSRNVTPITWACYPDGPEDVTYEVDDLELLR